MALTGWPVGTTKKFTGTITLDAASPDITSDTVTLCLKLRKDHTDDEAVLMVDADVTTYGANGIYSMTVDPSDTDDATAKKHYYDIVWRRSNGDEYVLESGDVYLTARVSDTGDD